MTIKEVEIQLALGTLSYDMKQELASDKRTSKKILTKLSTDEDISVRSCVAINSNTSVKVLTKLSTDKNWSVKHYVAKNPNTPKKVAVKI